MQMVIGAMAAASATAYAGLPNASSAAAAASFLRPPVSQPAQAVYRPNWLQMQAAAHLHKPAGPQTNPGVLPATSSQQGSWLEVKSEPTEKQPPFSQGSCML